MEKNVKQSFNIKYFVTRSLLTNEKLYGLIIINVKLP